MAGRRGQMMLSLWYRQKYYSARVLAWRFRVVARNDWTVTDYVRGGGTSLLLFYSVPSHFLSRSFCREGVDLHVLYSRETPHHYLDGLPDDESWKCSPLIVWWRGDFQSCFIAPYLQRGLSSVKRTQINSSTYWESWAPLCLHFFGRLHVLLIFSRW